MAFFSAVCYTYFFVSGFVGICIGLVLRLLTFPFDPDCRLIHNLTRAFVKHYLRAVPGWDINLEAFDKLPPDRPYVIVSNHQSALDPLLVYMLPYTFRWTAKTWVFRMPVIGQLLWLTKALEINKKHTLVFLNKSREVLNHGVSVMIFPEGTRSPDGELLPFKFGAFHLAVSENVPILPVVITGSRFIIPKGNFFALGSRARVTVEVLPSIEPADFNGDEKELRDYVRNAMAKELHKHQPATLVSHAELSEETA